MESVLQNSWQNIYLFIGIAFLLFIGVLSFFLIDRADKVKTLSDSLSKLRQSFNDLDEQAKLIIKTDLELNKTQEELDKRLNGLDALQKTSRLISTTLDETEIFERLNQPLLTELGFEKYLLATFTPNGKLHARLASGFTPEKTTAIIEKLSRNINIASLLEGVPLLSSLKTSQELKNTFTELFQVHHFILVPILAQKQMLGILFAGNHSDAFAITEGDEELVSILADQVSQSVENARLFEQVYIAKQGMEMKVQQRTQQLSSALEEVKKISKMKSEFISAVSHELRTPLTSIKGYAAILITGKVGNIPDKVKERLKKINKHSDSLVQLINNLLDIARIESGHAEMKFAPHDVYSLVENVEDILAPQMKEKNINFASDIDSNLPELFIDKNQIGRIFINLVSNAIKFTPEHGKITIKAQLDKEQALISVSDTGIGIKEEDAEKLFNEFYRVDNEINQHVKGTGLGLALAKKIVEAHQGKMWLTSKVREGTTFFFTLPTKNPESLPSET
ncbi:MAG: GAF domain-containing protein [Candidatus Omnitrophica bacterium]|nr:GAF domain-containing protein [Candidatus Omnitrophota bacterium]